MELYELTPKTLAMVESLRTTGNAGIDTWWERGTGKTTALMIYAKELLDEGQDVYYAYFNKRWAMNKWQQMFPQSVCSPLFISDFVSIRGRDRNYVLVDEPSLIGWKATQWCEIEALFKVAYAGGR